MHLVEDSLVNLMSILTLCHILKHQDVPRPSEEMQWHVYNDNPLLLANTEHSDMVWSGWGRLFSDTKYMDSLHKYLPKSLMTTHGTPVCIKNYQLLLIQTFCTFYALCFLNCNKKKYFHKKIYLQLMSRIITSSKTHSFNFFACL